MHNKYSEVDQVMRHFAKACTELPKDCAHVARKLEQILNTDVVIRDPSKVEVLKLKDRSETEDYQTVDSGVLAQPDFPYLPAFAKLQRIEQHKQAKAALKQTRELKTLLQNSNDLTQSKLMRSFGELEKLIEHLDADQQVGNKIGELHEAKVWKKASVSVNELAGQIIRESTGVEGVTWDNIE